MGINSPGPGVNLEEVGVTSVASFPNLKSPTIYRLSGGSKGGRVVSCPTGFNNITYSNSSKVFGEITSDFAFDLIEFNKGLII